MALRKNFLDISTWAIGGSSFLGVIQSGNFDIEVLTDDCQTISDRYHTAIPVKKRLTWNATKIPHVAGVCQSNLNVTVFSVDGTDFLGELESGSITISTDVTDGAGIADIYEFPNAQSTDVEVSTNLFTTSNHDIFQAAGANNITAVQVDVVVTVGGTSVTLPMTMTAASITLNTGEIQMQNVTFKLRGEPTSATGDALVLDILTGDAYVSWAVDTDAGAYSGNAIITGTSIQFNNSALVSMSHTFANQGNPGIVPAS